MSGQAKPDAGSLTTQFITVAVLVQTIVIITTGRVRAKKN